PATASTETVNVLWRAASTNTWSSRPLSTRFVAPSCPCGDPSGGGRAVAANRGEQRVDAERLAQAGFDAELRELLFEVSRSAEDDDWNRGDARIPELGGT